MIKVIAHGFNEYKTQCYQCGCIFKYTLEDIENGSVKCPDCSQLCSHNYTLNVTLTSRIKEVEV